MDRVVNLDLKPEDAGSAFDRRLTTKQAETLSAIVESRLSTGILPTQKDLQMALRLKSVATVHERLKSLRPLVVKNGRLWKVDGNHIVEQPDTARFLMLALKEMSRAGVRLERDELPRLATTAGIPHEHVNGVIKMLFREGYLSHVPWRSENLCEPGTRTMNHLPYLEMLAGWTPQSKSRKRSTSKRTRDMKSSRAPQ